MNKKSCVLTIDAGNTAIKVGVHLNGQLTHVHRFTVHQMNELAQLRNEYPSAPVVLSSVINESFKQEIQNLFSELVEVNSSTPLPIGLAYSTPESLGIDRICNAVAIDKLSHTIHSVSIDIGTCIKFDCVQNGHYQGGSISPGIQLRYNSMNDYTANLPLLNNREEIQLIGKSTKESIHSGVINGIQAEISGLMERYLDEIGSDLTFFVTGGDSRNFDFAGKNNIFADENLTLKGLYEIYNYNVQ